MKTLVSLGVSASILALIYWRFDLGAVVDALAGVDALWAAGSYLLLVPTTLMTAWRLKRMAPGGHGPSYAESIRLTLAGWVMNMVLPSKMGDVAKSYFMTRHTGLSGSLSLSLVVFEKSCDMLALLAWCVVGLLFLPGKDFFFWALTAAVGLGFVIGLALLGSLPAADAFLAVSRTLLPQRFEGRLDALSAAWREMHAYVWRNRKLLAGLLALSGAIWLLQLVQIWMFVPALGAKAPFLDALALVPLAILAGLVPLTFAGIGTRDAAFILLFAAYMDAPAAAALGVLATLRHLFAALAGLPLMGRYMAPVPRT